MEAFMCQGEQDVGRSDEAFEAYFPCLIDRFDVHPNACFSIPASISPSQ
jgi:hypothetical protein